MLLIVDRIQVGRDVAGPELLGRFRDGAMLGCEIFWGKDPLRRDFLEQERAARFGSCHACHCIL